LSGKNGDRRKKENASTLGGEKGGGSVICLCGEKGKELIEREALKESKRGQKGCTIFIKEGEKKKSGCSEKGILNEKRLHDIYEKKGKKNIHKPLFAGGTKRGGDRNSKVLSSPGQGRYWGKI